MGPPRGRASWPSRRIQLAMSFADAPPRKVVEWASANNTEFEIPAHAARHEVVGEWRFDRGGELLRLLPHMHRRGRAFRYELQRRDGSPPVTLLDVPRYDFNWQLWYAFEQPLRVEAGDVLRGRAWYDNSADNPSNPDPNATVYYGRQTTDEMMEGHFEWIPERPRTLRSSRAASAAQ